MTGREIDIDRIVREVTRRLRTDAPAPTGPTVSHAERPDAVDVRSAPTADPRELAIEDRVVTLETVDGRLHGVRRLVLRPDAVLTPSVRDELMRRNIAVTRCESSSESMPAGLVVGVAATALDPATVLKILGEATGKVEQLSGGQLLSVVTELAEAVTRRQRLGVLFTERVAAAVCLANHLGGVRAAAATDRRSACSAIESIGANVLIIDPAGRSRFELAAVVRQFVAAGLRQCPSEYRDLLEQRKEP